MSAFSACIDFLLIVFSLFLVIFYFYNKDTTRIVVFIVGVIFLIFSSYIFVIQFKSTYFMSKESLILNVDDSELMIDDNFVCDNKYRVELKDIHILREDDEHNFGDGSNFLLYKVGCTKNDFLNRFFYKNVLYLSEKNFEKLKNFKIILEN